MTRIIVVAERSTGTQVVLEERVVVSHLESEHSCAQLVERLGWAMIEAEELEQGGTTARAGLDPGRLRRDMARAASARHRVRSWRPH
jgi:hypothetical protein